MLPSRVMMDVARTEIKRWPTLHPDQRPCVRMEIIAITSALTGSYFVIELKFYSFIVNVLFNVKNLRKIFIKL